MRSVGGSQPGLGDVLCSDSAFFFFFGRMHPYTWLSGRISPRTSVRIGRY